MAILPPDPIYTLRYADMGAVHSICFYQNERLLAGTAEGKIYIWDLQTNRCTLHFNIGEQPITSLHHTDNLLICQEKGGTISIWSMVKTGYEKQHTLNGNYMGFCRSYLLENEKNPKECLLFYPSEKNSILILSINDLTEISPIKLVPDMEEFKDERIPKLGLLTCLKPFEWSGQYYVLTGYESGYFLTWNVCNKSILDIQQLNVEPLCVDYNTITNRGLIAGSTNEIIVFTYQRPHMQLKYSSTITIQNPGIHCIRIRNDMKVFCTGGWDGRIRIFSWKSLRQLAVLTEHKSVAIMDIAYCIAKVSLWNAPIMAVAGIDGQISLWDLYN